MPGLTKWLGPLQAGRGVLLWGEGMRPQAAAAAAWGVGRGAPVLVVDVPNRFDPYALAREARRRGLAPETALARVQVARAFTSHQLLHLLPECRCLPAPLELRAHPGEVLAFSEDTRTIFLEVLKFLGTVGLILATAVILLMME
jgi:hypothetical protein